MAETTRSRLVSLGDFIKSQIKDSLEQQGHTIGPGGVQDDIDIKVLQETDGFRLQVWMRHYAQYLERGVSAGNIPYSGRSGRGGTSQYIEGLRKFAERRGMENPLSAAFAIAATHKKEGMPSKGSFTHSKTGQRTGFLGVMEKENGKKIEDMIFNIFGEQVELQMDNMVKTNNTNQ